MATRYHAIVNCRGVTLTSRRRETDALAVLDKLRRTRSRSSGAPFRVVARDARNNDLRTVATTGAPTEE